MSTCLVKKERKGQSIMDHEIQSSHPIVFPVLALISLFLFWYISNKLLMSANKKNFPPSPRKLPIIGNLHQLSPLPHKDLQLLSKKHGPLMLLHFGSLPVLVVSSANAAREILTTHDLNLANKFPMKAAKKLLYDGKDVTFAPYGKYWRQIKSVLVHQLLSNKRVQYFRSVRQEETALFVEKIREHSSDKTAMNLSEMFHEFASNGICRSAFGRRYSESTTKGGKKVLMLFAEFMDVLYLSIGDIFPWLGWISRVNGWDKRVDTVAKEIDDFLEGVIQQHMEITPQQGQSTGENFVDILIDVFNDNNTTTADVSCIDKDSIKGVLLSIFAGGTDTISTTLEWVMAELLRHPSVMKKLQNEVREIFGSKRHVTDEDLEKMDYMRAVIKETLRCQPPSPFLAPRVALDDVKINGYDVPKGTVVLVNAWAIGRDPLSWDEPDKFEPERFLNKNSNANVDFKGLDFELIPFGAGRRGCPGISYAVATIEFVLANIVHQFNWQLPHDEDLDMTERPGASIRRASPLLAVAATQK